MMEAVKHLLQKYINDQPLQQQELALLRAWLGTEENWEVANDIINQALTQADTSIKASDAERMEMYQAVKSKILLTNTESDAAPVISMPLYKRKWTRYAAAIILVVGISVLIYQYYREDNVVLMPEVQLVRMEDNKEILPGVQQPQLVLSNNVVVPLDNIEGKLTTTDQVDIARLADGQLIYGQQKAGNSKEVVHHTLINPIGGKSVRILLSDGTGVWLNAESSIRYPTSFDGIPRKVEIEGEAYFEVAANYQKDQSNRTPFTVICNGVEVIVLGTAFNVNSYHNESTLNVSLLNGSVKLVSEGNDYILKKGQQAQVLHAFQSNIPNKVNIQYPNMEEVMGWKNGRFLFTNVPLEVILRQVARSYDVEIVYKNNIDDKYSINISRDIPLSQLIQFLEMSGGVKFYLEKNKIIVKK